MESGCVQHQTFLRLSLDSWENKSPGRLWGLAFAPDPPQVSSSQSHQAVWGVIKAVIETEVAPCSPPPSIDSLALFLSLWTLSQGIAQASCSVSFRSPELGPGRIAGQAHPYPSYLEWHAPCQVYPRDPKDLTGPRLAPSEGHIWRSSSPSRTLELNTPERAGAGPL